MTFPVLAFSGGVDIDFDLSFIAQMVLFATLIIVLKPLLFDPILKIFEEREKRTDGARAEARQMQERAGELLTSYEKELERVHRVAAEEREKMRLETARLEQDVLNEARRVSNQIVEQGRAQISKEVQAIQFDLGRQAERLAKELAATVLGREVS